MTTHYADDRVTLHHGDCLDVLRKLPDASVDAVVTDPPYGLEFMGKAWDSFGRDTGNGYQEKPRWGGDRERDEVPDDPRGRTSAPNYYTAGAPFQRWCEAWARECLRVLKPGGHLLAFGGSRTWHRLAVAIEDGGFEIRDSIAWLYGSGFPKSLDVSKAIDKARVEDHEPLRVICRAVRSAMDARGLRSRDLVEHFEGCHPRLIDHWAARDTDSQPSLPTPSQWDVLSDLFGELAEHDAEVRRLNDRKGGAGDAYTSRAVTGDAAAWENRSNYALTFREDVRRDRANKGTLAEQWQGWGTALKPAFEPIVIARKPLAGTVAGNVLEHGTGALNIDACRLDTVSDGPGTTPASSTGGRRTSMAGPMDRGDYDGSKGRWPANVVLDEDQAEALDGQSGTLTSGKQLPTHKRSAQRMGASGIYGNSAGPEEDPLAETYGDSGGASRFFYVAKAGTDERPRVGGVAHPTVKPLDLMRWLVRLITPPGGVVLEPFAGSGTTVEAALLEGFRCIAIEREAEYLPLIEARIARRRDPVRAVQLAGDDAGLFGLLEGETA